jgi:hypothetical protein
LVESSQSFEFVMDCVLTHRSMSPSGLTTRPETPPIFFSVG